MARARPGLAARLDLRSVGEVPAKSVHVLVVHHLDVLRAELAHAAARDVAPGRPPTSRTAGWAGGSSRLGRWSWTWRSWGRRALTLCSRGGSGWLSHPASSFVLFFSNSPCAFAAPRRDGRGVRPQQPPPDWGAVGARAGRARCQQGKIFGIPLRVQALLAPPTPLTGGWAGVFRRVLHRGRRRPPLLHGPQESHHEALSPEAPSHSH